jgi:hypothetical protein
LELKELRAQLEGPSVHRIMLTGGPCGGKTSAANALREKFENIGYRVYCVPEAATILFENMGMKVRELISTIYSPCAHRHLDGLKGGDWFGPDKADKTLEFQIQLARMQIALENAAIDLAKHAGNRRSIVLIDRGLMDGKAYCPDGVWPMILEELGMTTSMARDKRYDAVIHMVTAADGAGALSPPLHLHLSASISDTPFALPISPLSLSIHLRPMSRVVLRQRKQRDSP